MNEQEAFAHFLNELWKKEEVDVSLPYAIRKEWVELLPTPAVKGVLTAMRKKIEQLRDDAVRLDLYSPQQITLAAAARGELNGFVEALKFLTDTQIAAYLEEKQSIEEKRNG